MLTRSLIVIICYLLPSLGAIYAVTGTAALFDGGSLTGTIVLLMWFFAVSALFKMSHAWIRNIRLGRRYSRWAFRFGVSALFALPVLGALDTPGVWSIDASRMLVGVTFLELLLVFPAVALAVYLNRFHAAASD